jgi:hypothetical protein
MRTDTKLVDCRLATNVDPVADLPVLVQCREHVARLGKEDSTQSCAVYADHLHCFGCGFHIYRRMETLAFLLRIDLNQAFLVAHKYTSKSVEAYRDRAREEARRTPLPAYHALCKKRLLWGYRSDRMEWLLDRGLTLDTIDGANLGHDGVRFSIPFYAVNGDLITIRYRRDDTFGTSYYDEDPDTGEEVIREVRKYDGTFGRNSSYIYPEWRIGRCTGDTAFVTEGELDALRLWQEGYPAVSTINGAGNLKYVPELLRAVAPHITRLVCAADMDEAGDRGAGELCTAAARLGFGVERVIWPLEQGKDITEFLKNHTLKEARWELKVARNGLES